MNTLTNSEKILKEFVHQEMSGTVPGAPENREIAALRGGGDIKNVLPNLSRL